LNKRTGVEMTEKKVEVNWGVCNEDNHWCYFETLDLSKDLFNDFKGVYIIWSDRVTVRLGSGIIKDRVAAHRGNDKITVYPNLKVTWAKVHANQMEGVEKFLAETLAPKIGDRFPDRIPIEIDLPQMSAVVALVTEP
jgi:hypothetical protein